MIIKKVTFQNKRVKYELPFTYIKYEKEIIGKIWYKPVNTYKISFRLKTFDWITLKKDSSTLEEAKQFVRDNIQVISEKHYLNVREK